MLKENNPLISREGFNFIYNLIQNERISKTNLEQLLNSISPVMKDFYQITTEREKRKEIKKYEQISGIIQILSTMEVPREILEIGSGSALLSQEISRRYPQSKIICLDRNVQLTEKNKKRYSEENLKFISADAFSYESVQKGLVISLHGCGNLTDRVIDISLNSNSDILCIPCCYPKISIDSLPQSLTLLKEKDILIHSFKMAKKLDGKLNDHKRTRGHVLRDLYRTLINIDRALKIQEHGYFIQMKKTLSPNRTDIQEGRFGNSSHLYAIIGSTNQQFD